METSSVYFCNYCMRPIDVADVGYHRDRHHWVRRLDDRTVIIRCPVEGCDRYVKLTNTRSGHVTDDISGFVTERIEYAVRQHLKTFHRQLSMRERERYVAIATGGRANFSNIYSIEQIKELKW